MRQFVRTIAVAALTCLIGSSGQPARAESESEVLRMQVEALQARVAALEAQVRLLQQTRPAPAPASGTTAIGAPPVAAVATTGAPAAAPDAAYEQQAQALIDSVIRLTDEGRADEARAKIAELRTRYPSSRVAGQGTYFSNELDVIGKAAPATWSVSRWFQGGESAALAGKTTIVVFWEEWCPHCRDEMPKIQALYAANKSKGLQVVGLTKVTQSSTDEKVQSFLSANGIRFPVGKESGDPSTYFNVKGIPAAAIVKDGQIVWRGHPIRLTDALVQRWISAAPSPRADRR